MKKTLQIALVSGVALTALCGQAAMASEPGNFTLITGFDYSSGKYGGTDSTDILYIPFTGKYETGPWTLKLTVPYIQITGPGNVVRDVGAFRSSSSTTRTTESGLGDVVAQATYNVYTSGYVNPFMVDLTGKIKFGTADETKGLGTGQDDYAAQVDLYKTIDKFTAFGTVGYKVFGQPTGIVLNNVWYGSFGGSYKLSDVNSAGLIMDLRQKATDTGYRQEEMTAFVSHKIDKSWKTQAYLVKGFTSGSPDWGAGAMVMYAF